MKKVELGIAAFRAGIIFCTFATAFVSHADTGNEHGSGGDELRVIFQKARVSAVERVAKLKSCSFSVETPADIQAWVLANKYRLAEDIEKSEHIWNTDPQTTCAFTQTNPYAPIQLSFLACKSLIISESVAGEVLVHESVHHLGYPSEKFSDEVARAVYLASTSGVSGCPELPVDPFNPSSCEGDPMTIQEAASLIDPGQTSTSIGKYQLHLRNRWCNTLTGCATWKADSSDTAPYYLELFQNGRVSRDFPRLPKSGELRLFVADNGSTIRFRHLGDWSTCSAVDAKDGGCTFSQSMSAANSSYVYPSTSMMFFFDGATSGVVNGTYVPINTKGTLTNHCLRQAGRASLPKNTQGSWLEVEYVFFSQF